MSPQIKSALLWAISLWLCTMSVLCSIVWRAEPVEVVFIPTLTACFMGFVWLGSDAVGVKPWPAFAGWAFLVWQLTLTVFVIAVTS